MKRLIFDVESIGLHGEGFAVGWGVWDDTADRVVWGHAACDPHEARGSIEGRMWVHENVPSQEVTCNSPHCVRNCFWRAWEQVRDEGGQLWADCAWPVEARFLIACVDDDPRQRTWSGPYPLFDVSTVVATAGIDPTSDWPTLPAAQPQHDPIFDVLHSLQRLARARGRLGVTHGK